MRSIAVAVAIGFSTAGCSPEPPLKEIGYTQEPVADVTSELTEIRFQNSIYQRLTGLELRQAIVGKSIFYDLSGPGFVMVTGDGRYFNSDGCGYVRNRHHMGSASGSYSVKNDRICTRDEDAEHSLCFALLRSNDGQFLEQYLTRSSSPSKVVIKPNTSHDGFHSCPLIEPS